MSTKSKVPMVRGQFDFRLLHRRATVANFVKVVISTETLHGPNVIALVGRDVVVLPDEDYFAMRQALCAYFKEKSVHGYVYTPHDLSVLELLRGHGVEV